MNDVMPVIERDDDFVCQACGHLKDTPMHELGCIDKRPFAEGRSGARGLTAMATRRTERRTDGDGRMSEMESLRRYYGVPARRGGRIAYTWLGRREGTILSARDNRLWVRFDDTGRREGPFHPTWEVEYLDAR